MKNLKYIILAASVLFSTPIQATLKDDESIQCIDSRWSNWGYLESDESVEPGENGKLAKRIEPKILFPEGMDDPYSVRFVTSVNDLPRETWKEFKRTFTSFYEAAWKGQDPKDMGIEGTFKQFLHQQFDRALEDFRTNPNAVFLSITQLNLIGPQGLLPNISENSAVSQVAAISRKPILGIFARKDEYQFKGDDDDHYRSADCLFLRLLVMRDASVMKQFPAIAKALISETESNLGKQGIDAWLTVSRKGNPLAGMFEDLGFKPVSTDLFDDGTGSSYSTQDLVKNYPTGHYDYFLRDIQDDALSSSDEDDAVSTADSDSSSDDDHQKSKSLNVSEGGDDDDPIVSKEDLRTSSDSKCSAKDDDQPKPSLYSSTDKIEDIEDLGKRLGEGNARPNTPAPVTDDEVNLGAQEFHDVGDAKAGLVRDFFANDDAEKIWHH